MIDMMTVKEAVKGAVKGAVINRLQRTSSQPTTAVDYDVLIIGAGISGIGMGCRLQQSYDNNDHKGSAIKNKIFANKRPESNEPSKNKAAERFVILEQRTDLGGTWDLFTYPGVRSDSDALTFGYGFRPWLDNKMLAKGGEIKRYIADTAREFKLTEHIRYQHQVQQLSWSSIHQRWTAMVKNHATGEVSAMTANFVVGATGYYDYEAGYRPHFEGEEQFQGDIVHPQHWNDTPYHDKKVVIIGSGATAMTLLPALVDEQSEQRARHVTMLQRSPTYVASIPGDDYALDWLSSKGSPLSQRQAYNILRTRNMLMQQSVYKMSTYAPKAMKALLKYGVTKELDGSGVDVMNFVPSYNPWDERLCAVPDSDLFLALRGERAEVVTAQIDHFTETGIQLTSGKHIDADVIVTATGLQLQMLGGAALYVDGKAIDMGEQMTYKAVLLEDVPNMAVLFGSTNASWTLKIDLACQYIIRLLSYMEKGGYQQVCATASSKNEQSKNEHVQIQSDTILGALSAGYVSRAKDTLPKQGDRYPWQVTNNHITDRVMLKYRKINDEWLRFTR